MNQIIDFFGQSWTFTWIVLPLLIFFARITDQTIGTLRLIFLSKGYRMIVPFLGFFEVTIWLLAIGQIMKHLDNTMCYVAYGAGFAMGNFIGMTIEMKISLGTSIIRIILKRENYVLIKRLQELNYGLTIVDANGSRGKVKVLFSIIKRKELNHFISIINEYEPGAFYTIEEVKSTSEGVFRNVPGRSIFSSITFRIIKAR